MIEESYVSFETARMLKEAEFNCVCRKWYEWKDGEAVEWEADTDCNWNVDKNCYSRPTQALAARWLREVYNVAIYSFYDTDMEQWFYVVDAVTKNPVINVFQSGSEYDDYESAFDAGLREAIKLIKK